MLTGWNQIGGKWYYMYSSGAMAFNTWIGSYYVNGSGVWTKTRRSYPAGNYNVGSVYGPSLTQKELDQAFRHSVTIRLLDKDRFQYVSNYVSRSEIEVTWYTERLSDEKWEECYGDN